LLLNALTNVPTITSRLACFGGDTSKVFRTVLSAAIVVNSAMDSSDSYGTVDDAAEDPLGCRLALALAVAEASLTTGRFSV